MQLDNALRTGLLREGEAIPADVSRALPGIAARVRATRRRRAGGCLAAAAALAAAVWVPPQAHSPAPAPAVETRPAQQGPRPLERQDVPGSETRPSARGRVGRSGGPVARPRRDRTSATRRAAPAAGTPSRPGPEGAGKKSPEIVVPRRVTERYDVAYVAGTHVGESAGAGCSQGQSATRSNDCIAIQVGNDETRLSLRLADDAGVLVGAVVYQHVQGEGTELVEFCGATDGYVAVEPGALVLVYLDTSDRCAEDSPHTGTLVAHLE